ncbi:MAG TPA: xanthine dehydrogenase small subunit [Caldimonas sp.]|nr:xanthine dehydrogenase small subunit [Caldimonas sp.]
MPTRPIRFFHRGAVVEVAGAPPTRTLLDWLREDAHCTGTKEGCNEGDCGACTVVVGELAAPGDPDAVGGLALRTVNACIRLLPAMDGKALYTVEDLKTVQAAAHPTGSADDLHPVQRALVECHGSQCGFCTPGFAMSLWATYEHHRAAGTQPTRQQLADDLSGNLCRCTGYRPILDAGQRMFELIPAALDTASAVTALRALRDDAPLDCSIEGLGRYSAPRTLDALAEARVARPDATLLAGSTDIGLWITKMFRPLPDLIDLGRVEELKRIERTATSLVIGAGASLEAAYRALVAEWPALEDVWLRFASVPVRNAGTMGGNVANGSPIGDSAPVLMALDAALELRRGNAVRTLPLGEFYVDYMKNRLEPGEFVQAIVVPLGRPRQVRAYKLSKRFDCDISALCAGFSIDLDGTGTVRSARFAFGGMAAVVRRASGAEAAVVGQPWNEATLAAAQRALAADYTPLTDLRASAAYRTRAAQNLLRRFWLETRIDDPVPASRLSVWTVMPHRPPGIARPAVTEAAR